MKKSENHIGQIFFDGGSSLIGVGDESGKGGYHGRLEKYYTDYTFQAIRRRETLRSRCLWANVYGTGVIDRTVLEYQETVTDDLKLARDKGLKGYESRTVAVLLMGSSLLRLLRKNGNDQALALEDYASAMDAVQAVCEAQAVSVIGIGTPIPSDQFSLPNGDKPDSVLRQTTIELSQAHLADWNVPYQNFLPLQEITNASERAPDGAHLNAAGYDKVATLLISCINPLLEVDSSIFEQS
jgi:hypothetical protein